MSARRAPGKPPRRKTGRAAAAPAWRRWLLVGAILSTAAIVVAAVLFRPGSGAGTPVALARLGTQDVHSLAFPGPDSSTMLFGHHAGILRSTDAGRTWAPLPVVEDAMGISAAVDGSIIIAGHHVFQASHDGGATWAPIETDLPSLDIHSFARSLGDPSRMWAYLAEGGVYESTDGGRRWARVYDGHVIGLTAIRAAQRDALLGIESVRGLVRSEDGGATWSAIGVPPVAPVSSVAASADGRVVLLGGTDGLYRSDDGGSTWRQILRTRTVLASALWGDGSVIAAVDRDTNLFRSDDGGASWRGP